MVAVAIAVEKPRRELNTALARSMRPEDEPRVAAFFSTLSRETLRLRFMAYIRRVPPDVLRKLVHIDERREVALVAVVTAAEGDQIIGIASYHLDPPANRAEVAFVVADEWQNMGIGTFFLRKLIGIARSRGIAGLDGQTFLDNRAMRALLTKAGCPVRCNIVQGALDFHIDLSQGSLITL
jgi:acetyltransferase